MTKLPRLYPLKFKTIFKEKIWGGDKINKILEKDYSPLRNCGETWEISTVPGNVSEISNGDLKGWKLNEVIKNYSRQVMGSKGFKQYGTDFPLLIKFIDAADNLSVQVHPDNFLAQERHQTLGKTEMWYVLHANAGAKLNSGFNQKVDKKKYLRYLEKNKLMELLNFEKVSNGDVFFLPAGRIHAIGKGVMVAEIQQSSNITYRIYDWDRVDGQGKARELHTDEAIDAIDYSFQNNYKTPYNSKPNESNELVKCNYFTTSLLELDQPYKKNHTGESFIIYLTLEGTTVLRENGRETILTKGDCVLIPAAINNFYITPEASAKLLEVTL